MLTKRDRRVRKGFNAEALSPSGGGNGTSVRKEKRETDLVLPCWLITRMVGSAEALVLCRACTGVKIFAVDVVGVSWIR